MDFYDSLGAHLDRQIVDKLFRSNQGCRSSGALLSLDKISDEEFLSLCSEALPHPDIPHAYLLPEKHSLGKSMLFDLGCFYLQDPSAMLVSFLLSPTPGEIVLDYCAAPGGKSIGASLLMGNQGAILANDLSYPRAKEMSRNIERMGRGDIAITSGEIDPNLYREYFDSIILDAPCSGSAMFRKNELALKDWTFEKVLRCSYIQDKLLDNASLMVKPGGKIIYSTCSFSYEEDEAVILSFLEKHEDFELLPLEVKGGYHHPSCPAALRLFPFDYPGEGHFIALLQKKGERKQSLASIKENKDPFFAHFAVKGRHNVQIDSAYYSLPFPLKIRGLSLLRYGVKLGEANSFFQPDFAYARFASVDETIPLDEGQVKQYLRGESFPLVEKDGFHIVSDGKRALGYVKIVKNIAKNHYPKGLRYSY